MAEENSKLSREERLAAKLRENLHRRKAQARAMTGALAEDGAARAESKEDHGALPKEAPKS